MLVGREESVERVEQALAQRLPVVVTGAPGAGKTRLATEIARRGRMQDQEVAWVDLPNMEFRTGWFETEIERWSRRHPGGLVVIDNAESNIDAAVEAVDVVRRVAIDVGVIVTSRFPPPIDAVVERLGALGLPDGSSDDAIESANAVRLLRELLASPRTTGDGGIRAGRRPGRAGERIAARHSARRGSGAVGTAVADARPNCFHAAVRDRAGVRGHAQSRSRTRRAPFSPRSRSCRVASTRG